MNIKNPSNFILLASFSLLFSCSSDSPEEIEKLAGITPDITAPIISEVTAIEASSLNKTPSYVFSSDSVGTISYAGSCQSDTTTAVAGENTVTFDELDYGTYSDCVIKITDEAGNISDDIAIPSFTIEAPDVTAPILSEVTAIEASSLNKTPSYVFSSDSVGTISYAGSCQSDATTAVAGENTVTFDELDYGTYSDCVIKVTDEAGNISANLVVSSFTIKALKEVHQAKIQFPIENSNLGGVPKMTVRGLISRNDMIDFSNNDVASVTVNGQAASLIQDDSGSWSVLADVLADTAQFNAVITFSDTSTQNISIDISNQTPIKDLSDMVYDAQNKMLYLASYLHSSIIKVDVETNNRSLLLPSDDVMLTDRYNALSLDEDNNRVIVAAGGRNDGEILAVDLTTGNQTLLSSTTKGAGTLWQVPSAITYDKDNNLIYLLDPQNKNIYKVALDTGNRTIISNSAIGTGDNFIFIQSLQLDINNNRLLVLDSTYGSIVGVDLTTGNRTKLSSSNGPVGTGDTIKYFSDVNYNSATGKLLVSSYNTLIDVDLATGNRTTFSEIRVGTDFDYSLTGNACCIDLDENNHVLYMNNKDGSLYKIDTTDDSREKILSAPSVSGIEVIKRVEGVTINPEHTMLYLTDYREKAVFSVEIATGITEYVSGALKGSGDALDSLRDIEYYNASNQLIVVDNDLDALVAIDIASGNRTEISGPNVGTGSRPNGPEGLVIDQTTQTAYLTDNTLDEVFKIDLATGNRTLFAGTGNLIPDPQAATFDHVNNLLYIADDREDQILSVDTNNGDRVDVSSDIVGTGPDINIPQDIAYDAANDRILMADSSNDYILSVNPATGERVELSSMEVGNGISIQNPDSIAVDNLNGIVYTVTSINIMALAVDLATGDRVIISH